MQRDEGRILVSTCTWGESTNEREREHVFQRGGVRLGSGGVIELLSLSFSVAIANLDSLLINKEGITYYYVSLHPANLSIFASSEA